MKDYKLKQRNLRASHTLGRCTNIEFFFKKMDKKKLVILLYPEQQYDLFF